MSEHIVVCPPELGLLAELRRRTVVVETGDALDLPPIRNLVRGHEVHLHAIRLNVVGPLTSAPFDWNELQDAPLAIYPSKLGPKSQLWDLAPMLKRMNVRIFLSTIDSDSPTDLHLLSSLGIACGLEFGDGPLPWGKVNDLMHYAIYSQTDHAPIEPFSYIATHYRSNRFTDFDSVYFSSPARFVYIDADWHVALSRADLKSGNFVGDGPAALADVTGSKAYAAWRTRWQELMLQDAACAYCPAFRICTGRFLSNGAVEPGCKEFFSDMMDAAEYHQSASRQKSRDLWQL